MMAAFEQAWSIWEEEEGKGREGIWRFLERRWTWHPRSPSPKMRPPSVTTIASTFFSGQFFRQSKICPLQRILFCQSLVVKERVPFIMEMEKCLQKLTCSLVHEGAKSKSVCVCKSQGGCVCNECHILVIQAYEETTRAMKDLPIFLTRITLDWCINNWQKLLHILDQHLVEQSLVPFLPFQDSHSPVFL